MKVIKTLVDRYEARQARRWNEAARAAAQNLLPEPWQCERCSGIIPADKAECPYCPTWRDHMILSIITGTD